MRGRTCDVAFKSAHACRIPVLQYLCTIQKAPRSAGFSTDSRLDSYRACRLYVHSAGLVLAGYTLASGPATIVSLRKAAKARGNEYARYLQAALLCTSMNVSAYSRQEIEHSDRAHAGETTAREIRPGTVGAEYPVADELVLREHVARYLRLQTVRPGLRTARKKSHARTSPLPSATSQRPFRARDRAVPLLV